MRELRRFYRLGSTAKIAPRPGVTRLSAVIPASVVVLVGLGLLLQLQPLAQAAQILSCAAPRWSCPACRCRTGRSPSWCRADWSARYRQDVGRIVGDRQGRVLELLQALRRDLAAERAGGDLTTPKRHCRGRRISPDRSSCRRSARAGFVRARIRAPAWRRIWGCSLLTLPF